MLDLVSRGAQGHRLVHLLLTSAAEVGFAWDGGERVGSGLPSLLYQDDGWSHSALLLHYPGCLALSCLGSDDGKGGLSWELILLIIMAHYNCLSPPT